MLFCYFAKQLTWRGYSLTGMHSPVCHNASMISYHLTVIISMSRPVALILSTSTVVWPVVAGDKELLMLAPSPLRPLAPPVSTQQKPTTLHHHQPLSCPPLEQSWSPQIQVSLMLQHIQRSFYNSWQWLQSINITSQWQYSHQPCSYISSGLFPPQFCWDI